MTRSMHRRRRCRNESPGIVGSGDLVGAGWPRDQFLARRSARPNGRHTSGGVAYTVDVSTLVDVRHDRTRASLGLTSNTLPSSDFPHEETVRLLDRWALIHPLPRSLMVNAHQCSVCRDYQFVHVDERDSISFLKIVNEPRVQAKH